MTGAQWYSQAKWEVFKREDVANVYGEDLIIRYVEMTDTSHLEDAVTYIKSLATFTDPVVRGKPVTGTWVTRSVWYEEGRPYGKAGTLRLYHAMCPQGSDTGDGLYVTEDGCSYKVTYTFFWRQASLMKPVTPGTSGIEYSIKGQSKDPVTGFWNYVLEKREQFTTWTGIVTAADDIFKTVTEQTFLGVRTGDVLAFKAGADVGTLWTAGNPTAGTLIENVSVSKNDNCTTNVTQRKTVAKAAQGTVERSRTAFGDRQTITLLNQPTAVDAFVAVANGVVTVHAAKPNADGTFDNTETLLTAIPGEYSVERSRTAFSESVSITLRNHPTAVDAFVNVTGGIITRRSSKKNDDGTFDNTETLTTAIPGEYSVERTRTAFWDKVTITLKNQTTAVNAFVSVSGGIVTTQGSKKNDDGTFDNTQSLMTAIAGTGSITSRRTLYGTEVSTTLRNQAVAVSALVAVSGGIVTTQSFKANEDKTFDNTETLNAELWVSDAVKTVAKTPFATTTVTENANAESPLADPSVNGTTVKNVKTDGGRYTQTETKVDAVEGVVERTKTLWENTRHVVTEWVRNLAAKKVEPTADVTGVVKDVLNTLNDLGKYDAQEETDTAVRRYYTQTITDADGNYTLHLLENYTVAEMLAFLNTISASNKVTYSPSISRYPGMVNATLVARSVTHANSMEIKTKYSNSATEKIVRISHTGGSVFLETYTVSFTVKRDKGVKAGRLEYDALVPSSGNPWGSDFNDLGRDWYWYKAVTGVTMTTSDITSAYEGHTAITVV